MHFELMDEDFVMRLTTYQNIRKFAQLQVVEFY